MTDAPAAEWILAAQGLVPWPGIGAPEADNHDEISRVSGSPLARLIMSRSPVSQKGAFAEDLLATGSRPMSRCSRMAIRRATAGNE